MLKTKSDIVDRYWSIKNKGNFRSEEQAEEHEQIVNKYFRNKNMDEIADYLIATEGAETGGLTALSGFYYQFLVTIEYIIEMLEGKWDFVIMEHHDDIVVGKNKCIRFVQVKSSQKVKLNVTDSPASGLYLRKNKKIGEKYFRQANSWVDKLISNAEIALKSEGYETEFQLYSSYHFIKTLYYDLDHYTDNRNYDKELDEGDHLLNKMIEPVFNEDGEAYSYIESCGESEKDLLKRFYLNSGVPLQEIEVFQNHLCVKLSKVLFKEYGQNITIRPDDLKLLIGYLFEKCTYKNNIDMLLITEENIKPIIDEIRNRAFSGASDTVSQHDSLRIIDKVITELISKTDGFIHSLEIQNLMYEYKEYLDLWVQADNGDIKSLLERLFEGTNKTVTYSKLTEVNKEESLVELFTIVVMLNAGEDSKLEFHNNESLIIKKAEGLKCIYAFLRLKVAKKKEIAIERLQSIIRSSSVEDQFYFLESNLNVVIQNYNDRAFNSLERIEIKTEEIDVSEFKEYQKLNEVPIIVSIIPGTYLKDDLFTGLDEEESIKVYLKNILGKLKESIS